MKFLIISSTYFLPQFTELGKELQKNNIDNKIMLEYTPRSIREYLEKRRKKKEFRKLIRNFDPDFVISDYASDFALEAISAKKPLIMLLRGDDWRQQKIAYKKMKKSPLRIFHFWLVNKIAERGYEKSTMILPVCKYLQDVVQKRYPEKPTKVLHIGIDPINWNDGSGMNLKHPCIGIIQKAIIWEKTKEMLILPEILKKLPNVNFYWAGDGHHSNEIISVLGEYKNFHWLGALDYPQKVKDFLSEIDIYALFSGLDMTPVSILEASLMSKPVLATNIGGIPEIIKDKETGFLIEKGNNEQWVALLQFLLENPDKAKLMADQGREFILENFSLELMAKKLISYCETIRKSKEKP